MRGRKSAAALGVVALDGGTSRLKPPASLSEAERKVFVDLVSFVDDKHFVPSDLPLLSRYVDAVVLSEQAAYHCQSRALRLKPWQSPPMIRIIRVMV